MYKLNGLDLSSREYALLENLVSKPNPKAFAESKLRPQGEYDPCFAVLLESLADKRLVLIKIDGDEIASFIAVTELGNSFLADLETAHSGERVERLWQWRREFLCSVLGAISGAVAGVIFGYIATSIIG